MKIRRLLSTEGANAGALHTFAVSRKKHADKS